MKNSMILNRTAIRSAIVAFIVGICSLTSASATVNGFNDTFDTINPAWTTDRYEPNGFSVENFLGDNRLAIHISSTDSSANRPAAFSSTFYNTQGRQRGGTADEAWSLKGQVYVDAGMVSSTSAFRTDLWARTSSDGSEANAEYGIIGIVHANTTDPFNQPANATTWRVWDADTANGWVDLPSVIAAGWNDVMIEATAGGLDYYLNGNLVYQDLTVSAPSDLTTAFVQAYNYGPNGAQNLQAQAVHQNADYTVHWDNIGVSAAGGHGVPDGANTFGMLSMLGAVAGMMKFARSRNKAGSLALTGTPA